MSRVAITPCEQKPLAFSQGLLLALSPFLCGGDLARLLLASHSTASEYGQDLRALASLALEAFWSLRPLGLCARPLAARKLAHWWKRHLLLRWLSAVRVQAGYLNLQLHLLQANSPVIQDLFRRGRRGAGISLGCWRAVDIWCPSCRSRPLEVAIFYFERRRVRTVPQLELGCNECIERKISWLLQANACYISRHSLAPVLEDYTVSVSARSWNVLRYREGLRGLAYST